MTDKTKEKTRPVHLTESTYAELKKMADAKGVTLGEAAASLVSTAIRRRAAVNKYSNKKKQAG